MKCLFSEKVVNYFTVNWNVATSEEVENFKCCINTKNKCGNIEYIIRFVYKEHVHYIRYINELPLGWAPYLNTNKIPLIDKVTGLFIAAELNQSLVNAKPLGDVPVIVPDYSSVDVGKGIQWPIKVFAPYVDSTAWPPYSLVDSFNATKGLFYNLGFIVSKSPTVCEATWGTYYTGEAGPLNDQIKAIRALGGDVTVSFGGAANVPLHIVAPDVNSLYIQYKSFAVAYGLRRIDFDLEGIWIASSYNEANIRNSQAIKQLQDYYKSQNSNIDVWFTLPVLPTGLTNDGLNILKLAINAGVNIKGVNAMTMDYGDDAAPNPTGKMGEYGIEAITSVQEQLKVLYGNSKTDAELWAMIGTTPMIGVNDIQTEVFTTSDATQTLQFAEQKNIGLISMWSSNRDMPGGSGITQSNYEFALIFEPYDV